MYNPYAVGIRVFCFIIRLSISMEVIIKKGVIHAVR